MSIVNIPVKKLMSDDLKITFLVGAGSSIGPPSGQPDAKTMMNAIIDYTCAESETPKIKDLKGLKFETLLAIVQELDPNLSFIDYYEQCDKPNIQQFFLAEMMEKGHIVLTTNFDFLIEYALMQLKTPKKQIVPVITGKNFLKFRDPLRLLKKNKKIIYKVHGATKNVITEEDTRDSLIASIRAIGLNKEESNIFELQPYKYLSLKKALKDRTLVVMGYSGNNDFDIIPTIKAIENIQNIIWINHIEDYEGREKIYEIDSSIADKTDELSQVDKILVELSETNNAQKIYRIDTNTTKLLRKLTKFKPRISQDIFLVNPLDWFKEKLKKPSDFNKWVISQAIYSFYNKCDDTLKCFEKTLHILKESKGIDTKWETSALDAMEIMCKDRKNYSVILDWFKKSLPYFELLQDYHTKAGLFNLIGLIYLKQKNYPKAFYCFKQALEIYSDSDDKKGKLESFINIGICHQDQLRYPEAVQAYEHGLVIIKKIKDQEKKAEILNNQGLIIQDKPNYPKALKHFERALSIFEKRNDLEGKVNTLHNIGFNYHYEGNDSKALEILEEAIEITEQTGNLQKKVQCLKVIGDIYRDQWDFLKAIEKFKEAVQITDQLENLEEKVDLLTLIGSLYQVLKYYPEALDYYYQALNVAERLVNFETISNIIHNIGIINLEEGLYEVALNRFEEALEIDEQIDNFIGKAQHLIKIGYIYKMHGAYDTALEKLGEALVIEIQLNNLTEQAKILRMIGTIYQDQRHFQEALNQYNEAFYIFNELDDLVGKAACLNSIGLIYKTLENYSEALNCFEQALQINDQLKDLPGKAIPLYNIGIIYHNQKNFHEAQKRYEMTLGIYEQLGYLSGKIACLNCIGLLHQDQKEYDEALKRYNSILKFHKFDILEDKKEVAKAYYHSALIYHEQGDFYKSIEQYENALEIFDQFNDKSYVAPCLFNIGNVYHALENLSEAKRYYKEALAKYKQLNDFWEMTTCQNNLGIICQELGDYKDALRYYIDVIENYDIIGDKERKAKTHGNIGLIHFLQANYIKALKYYEISLKLLKSYDLGETKTAKNIKEMIKESRDNYIVKEILKFEYKNRRDIPPKKWVKRVNDYMVKELKVGINETDYYLNLINKSMSYKKDDLEELNSLGSKIIEKITNPTLYDLIVSLELNLKTAKQVGKLLKNQKKIKEFPLIPVKSVLVSSDPEINQIEEKLIKRSILSKLLGKRSRKMPELDKEFKETRISMANFSKTSKDFDYREIIEKLQEFLIY